MHSSGKAGEQKLTLALVGDFQMADTPVDYSNAPRLIDFPELSRITTLKRTALYELIKLGELKPIKLGRKTVFSKAEVHNWVNARLSSRG
jgi:excisionase family DNA binding protein